LLTLTQTPPKRANARPRAYLKKAIAAMKKTAPVKSAAHPHPGKPERLRSLIAARFSRVGILRSKRWIRIDRRIPLSTVAE
jgi:hypothetical protein